MKKALISLGSVVSILFFLRTVPCYATATGLNNIPTADVPAKQELVFQQFSDYGEDRLPKHSVGAKYGLIENVEIGVDGTVGPEGRTRGPAVLQGKVRLRLGELFEFSEKGPDLGIGATDINWDSKRAGRINPYAVLTHDFNYFRSHAGYSIKDNQEGFFWGVDKGFPIFGQPFTFRTDLVQINKRNDLKGSVGFIMDLHERVLVEGWYTFSDDSGSDDVYTLKFDLVF